MRAETCRIFLRPCEALIFDPDGMPTDAADIHYLAWKRLADEIAVPFDRRINQRFKGVDRMASLDIVLEHAGHGYDDGEKRLLAVVCVMHAAAMAAMGMGDAFEPGAAADDRPSVPFPIRRSGRFRRHRRSTASIPTNGRRSHAGTQHHIQP